MSSYVFLYFLLSQVFRMRFKISVSGQDLHEMIIYCSMVTFDKIVYGGYYSLYPLCLDCITVALLLRFVNHLSPSYLLPQSIIPYFSFLRQRIYLQCSYYGLNDCSWDRLVCTSNPSLPALYVEFSPSGSHFIYLQPL